MSVRGAQGRWLCRSELRSRCGLAVRRVRPLAVTGKARSPQLKDVPTMEEVGFKGFDAMQWYGSVGPAGMSADVVRALPHGTRRRGPRATSRHASSWSAHSLTADRKSVV